MNSRQHCNRQVYVPVQVTPSEVSEDYDTLNNEDPVHWTLLTSGWKRDFNEVEYNLNPSPFPSFVGS